MLVGVAGDAGLELAGGGDREVERNARSLAPTHGAMDGSGEHKEKRPVGGAGKGHPRRRSSEPKTAAQSPKNAGEMVMTDP